MRLLFVLMLALGCDSSTPNQNTCGELGNQPCCPGQGRPTGLSCTVGSFCSDELATFTCSCDNALWSCHTFGAMPDLAVTSTD